MQLNKIRAGVAGGAGYTGGELLRILLQHSHVEIGFVHSRSNAGKLISQVHKDLTGDTMLSFTEETDPGVDVLFLCFGHGEAANFLETHVLGEQTKIIDLSNDFRINDKQHFGARTFIYGLPEYNRDRISCADNIANPGCFATAIQLALIPLALNNSLSDVHITGITGSTGAGQKLQQSSHFSWRAGNVQPYKTLCHQHVPEVMQTLTTLQPGLGTLHFTPWRGDFTRGIFLTAQTHSDRSEEEVYEQYESFYKDHPFTYISREMIDLKQVINTNKCFLHLEKQGNQLVIHAAIDNLLKGAAGQAVQNMNLMFRFDETAGLRLKSSCF